MNYVKPVLIAAILMSSLLCSEAQATERPPRPAETAPEARADPAPAKPAKPAADLAPPKKPIKRRAVQQIIDGMPPSTPAPNGPVYGPRLTPSTPLPLPSTLPPSAAPPPRTTINSCDAGGCTDTNGTRYNGGVGNTLLSPTGRLCSNNGITVQCF